ncbi:MAG: 2-amino-4-hydroxy-6-hydroxymethyldihydropteridine diphosphokinase [Candidatus Thiothrix moscowensis]|nr:2-amino-4-hydroxy-6-hydroxymethyldihydropteridine diphosphokinase [Candidatus Thiothrix moscowensis]
MANVYISIGSNIDRETNICSCIQRLRQAFRRITLSHVYESPAEGFSGEPFLNLVAGFDTNLSPDKLRIWLRQLEDDHGRIRSREKYSDRTLDADLLMYGDLNLQPGQNLPHNDILRYPFVLFPLAEIASEALHPALQQNIGTLANQSILSASSLKPVKLTCR